jgi:hypothetical protein
MCELVPRVALDARTRLTAEMVWGSGRLQDVMVGSVKSGDAPSHLRDLADHALDNSGLPEAPTEVNVHVPRSGDSRRTPVRWPPGPVPDGDGPDV